MIKIGFNKAEAESKDILAHLHNLKKFYRNESKFGKNLYSFNGNLNESKFGKNLYSFNGNLNESKFGKNLYSFNGNLNESKFGKNREFWYLFSKNPNESFYSFSKKPNESFNYLCTLIQLKLIRLKLLQIATRIKFTHHINPASQDFHINMKAKTGNFSFKHQRYLKGGIKNE